LIVCIAVYFKPDGLINLLIKALIGFFLVEILLRLLVVLEISLNIQLGINSRIRKKVSNSKGLYFENHPYSLYVKTPNAGGSYPSNNLGYAGKRPTTIEKDKGITRIYCVGGSTIQNHDISNGPDSHWPGIMEDLLNNMLGSKCIEVINAGASAYTSAESLSEFMFRGVDLRPDILLIYHNVNDAWQAQMIDGFKSDYTHARKSALFKVNWLDTLPNTRILLSVHILLHELTKHFGKKNALVYRISNAPWTSSQKFDHDRVKTFKRNIENMIVVAQANNVYPAVVKWECDWESKPVPQYFVSADQNELSEKLQQYLVANNNALKELAEEYKLPFIEPGPFSASCFSDKIHFNSKGLNEMANKMCKEILPIAKEIISKK